MIAPDILRKFAQGLEPNPGGDLSRSMIFHDRHIQPQILAGLNGDNWGLEGVPLVIDYVPRKGRNEY